MDLQLRMWGGKCLIDIFLFKNENRCKMVSKVKMIKTYCISISLLLKSLLTNKIEHRFEMTPLLTFRLAAWESSLKRYFFFFIRKWKTQMKHTNTFFNFCFLFKNISSFIYKLYISHLVLSLHKPIQYSIPFVDFSTSPVFQNIYFFFFFT